MFIVSGGSSGLGLATVTDLLTSHAYILIIDLKPPNKDLKLTLSCVKFFQTDITKVDKIEKAVEGTVAWLKETGSALAGVDLQHQKNSMTTAGKNNIIVIVENEVCEHEAGRSRPIHLDSPMGG